MVSQIELYINGKLVDGLDDAGIQLELSVKQVQYPEENTGLYSYDFDIPGTDNNNILFTYIFEVTETNNFNPNASNVAELRIDGLSVMKGVLQLNTVTLIEKNTIIYNATLYGYTKSLFIDTKDFYVKDLDFSAYDHIPYHAIIANSWNHTSSDVDGYVYPLIDYGWDFKYSWSPGGGNAIDIAAYNIFLGQGGPFGANFPYTFLRQDDLYPAVFVKTIIDNVFEEFGYTYKSEFLNSSDFKKLVIPYSNPYSKVINFPYSGITTSNQNVGGTMPVLSFQAPIFDVYNNIERVYLSYNTAVFFNTFVCRFQNSISGQLRIDLNWAGSSSTNVYINKANFHVNNIAPSGEIFMDWNDVSNQEVVEIITLVNGQNSYVLDIDMIWGELIYVVFDGASPGDTVLTGSEFSFYDNSVYTGLTNTVSLSRCVPQDLKVNDFLSVINRMFNLHWEYDRADQSLIYIEPYQEYYSNTGVTHHDWNYKIDQSTVGINLSSDIQKHKITFKYDDADDYMNTQWTEKFSNQDVPNYGSISYYNSNNKFLDDEGLEMNLSPFLPTTVGVLTYTQEYYVPKYFADDVVSNPKKNTDIGCRILYYNGKISVPTQTWFWDDAQYGEYPQVSTMNDMILTGATVTDINFNTIHPYFYNNNPSLYPTTNITDNNLYNTYWKDYLDWINHRYFKMITAVVNLNEVDLYKLRICDTIDYDGCFWRINKLLYKVGKELHEVELVKVTDAYSGGTPSWVKNKEGFHLVGPIPKGVISGNITLGGLNFNDAIQSVVVGKGNVVHQLNATAWTQNVLIAGDNNAIKGETNNISILGSNNSVISGATNVQIFGNGVTADTSNSTYVGGKLYLGNKGGELAQGLKRNINASDYLTVKEDFQYHIYRDFSVSGNVITSGQTVIEDGDLILHGLGSVDLYGNDGEVMMVDEKYIVPQLVLPDLNGSGNVYGLFISGGSLVYQII